MQMSIYQMSIYQISVFVNERFFRKENRLRARFSLIGKMFKRGENGIQAPILSNVTCRMLLAGCPCRVSKAPVHMFILLAPFNSRTGPIFA